LPPTPSYTLFRCALSFLGLSSQSVNKEQDRLPGRKFYEIIATLKNEQAAFFHGKFHYYCVTQKIRSMEATTETFPSKEQIIVEKRAKLERVLKQVEPGLALEIIRYGKNGLRTVTSQIYNGGNHDFFSNLMRAYFDDVSAALAEGQNIRIQLRRVK
jgi:hypothetical protein